MAQSAYELEYCLADVIAQTKKRYGYTNKELLLNHRQSDPEVEKQT